MSDKPARDRMIAKIRALLEKTVENGCTEAEAMGAAAKASNLMHQYELSMTDVEIGATECSMRKVRAPRRDHPVQWCLNAIAHFTDTKVWFDKEAKLQGNFDEADLFGASKTNRKTELLTNYVFFGFPHDCEIAEYMVDICKSAMDRGTCDFRKNFGTRPSGANRSCGDPGEFDLNGSRIGGNWDPNAEFDKQLRGFLHGMAASMSEKLHKLKEDQRIKAECNGRSLVVVKSAAVDRALSELGMRFKEERTKTSGDNSGYSAGRAAGRGVNFNAGVGSGGRPLEIGAS